MAKRRNGAPQRIDAGFAGFDRGTLTFFKALKRNNRRDWFTDHRDEYDNLVLVPMRALVEEMDLRLARIAPELVGDPKRSLFRIHRDVRFSKDKSPYKTHAACWFYHADAGRGVGGEAHGGAGFYFHIEPGRSTTGGGIWMPAKPALDAIRAAVAARPEPFTRIVRATAFRRRFGDLDPEGQMRRVPRGYAADDPAAEWLRYKSFTAGRMLTDREVLDPRLPEKLERDVLAMTPLIRWLNSAIGFPPVGRRL